MDEQVGGIVVDAKGGRLLQLARAIAAAQEADAERPAARRRQHVPNAVADTIAVSIGAPSRSAAARKRSGSGLAYLT